MKEPKVFVLHALECAARIERFTIAGEAEFLRNELIQGAVLHNLQVMAQSIMRLPDELKVRHGEVDWRGLAGFRNVLVHEYLGVNVQRVWEIVHKDLPTLRDALEAMRAEVS